MTNRIGTRAQWIAARADLLAREKELTRMGDELALQRRELPWVPVEKHYTLETESGARTLAELFDGRSQLMIYHFMFGSQWEAGCPTCSSTADSFNGILPHLEACDVTMICVSDAPLEKLLAYRERMGWGFPYVSTYETDFAFDFGLALTPQQAQEIPEVKGMLDSPPEWLEDWGRQIGAPLEDGLREGPAWIAFARENGSVYHTYTVSAPDPFVAPYHSFLLERAPKANLEDFRAWRKDEYPD